MSEEPEVTIEATTAGTGGIKLFGEWSFENIEVRDPGLKRYLKVAPVFMPHSGGRHEARKFQKSEMSIVERLVNGILKPGSSGGDKPRVTNAVRTAFKIVNVKSGRNPIEMLVRAVENCAPNEDTTRIGYGGVVYRLAVDISPQTEDRPRPQVHLEGHQGADIRQQEDLRGDHRRPDNRCCAERRQQLRRPPQARDGARSALLTLSLVFYYSRVLPRRRGAQKASSIRPGF